MFSVYCHRLPLYIWHHAVVMGKAWKRYVYIRLCDVEIWYIKRLFSNSKRVIDLYCMIKHHKDNWKVKGKGFYTILSNVKVLCCCCSSHIQFTYILKKAFLKSQHHTVFECSYILFSMLSLIHRVISFKDILMVKAHAI